MAMKNVQVIWVYSFAAFQVALFRFGWNATRPFTHDGGVGRVMPAGASGARR